MPRLLIMAGLAAMLLGALDPLEGSLLILPGAGLAALGARLSGSPRRRLLYWSFLLTAAGVGALFALSALGGVGGQTGRSYWWGLVALPYLAGWILGLVGAVRVLTFTSRHA